LCHEFSVFIIFSFLFNGISKSDSSSISLLMRVPKRRSSFFLFNDQPRLWMNTSSIS
jgi:hypothetical protein